MDLPRIINRPKWARPAWDFDFLKGGDCFKASLWVATPWFGFTIFFPDWFSPGDDPFSSQPTNNETRG